MKKPALCLIILLLCTIYSYSQALYGANKFGVKENVIGYYDKGTIYSANRFGLKDKVIGFLDGGKICRANEFGMRDKVAGFVNDEKLYAADEFGNKKMFAVAHIKKGIVYLASSMGMQSTAGGYYDGDPASAGAACAAVLLVLSR